MAWHLSADIDAFAGAAGALLRREPVANTVVLTAVEEFRAGLRWGSGEPMFGWLGGDARAAVCRFPPFEFVLSAMSAAEAAELADALRSQEVPAVRGPQTAVEAFTARWVECQGGTAEAGRRQRLYRLSRLRGAAQPASGTGRPAGPADVGLVVGWLHRFSAEAGSVPVDRGEWVRDTVTSGLIWLWHDRDEPVAVACRHAPVESVSRVGPVYTPPEHRRHGYGTAVTAAVTADALTAGADGVVLFADLANPSANGIYTALGYQAVDDVMTVHFRPPT